MFSKFTHTILLTPFLIWSTLFIFVPLIFVIGYGLTDTNGHFSFENLILVSERSYFQALMTSVLMALICTIFCLVISYPLCLILTEKKREDTTILSILFVLPLWMNSLLTTMAWQTILERNGILNQIFRTFSLPDVNLINTPTAIVIGMIYNFLPYMILPLYISLSKIDNSILEAAYDLGASYWQTFFKIILPLSLRGAISGITMVFIPALTTFVISALLGGGKLLLIGNVIEQEFIFEYDWHVGCALSITLMLFIILSVALTTYFDNSERKLL